MYGSLVGNDRGVILIIFKISSCSHLSRLLCVMISCGFMHHIYIEKTEYNSEIQLELIDPAKKFMTRPY